MKKVTERALRGSIRKWEGILKGGMDNGSDDCPLCKRFCRVRTDWETYDRRYCMGPGGEKCPAGEHCENTPYDLWCSHHESVHDTEDHTMIHCDTCRDLAQQELDFLKSLLPKE